MPIKSAIASHSRNRLAAEKRTCGRIPLRDCFQVVSPRRRRDQTKAWVPTEGYFTKKAAGMRVIWLSTRFYQCAQLSCAQASPFSRWNKGLRGQTAPPPPIPKNENTKMENRLSRAGSAHFPSGWLTQAKIFFFFYTNQFSHSSMRRIIRMLRSNFLPRPPALPPFPEVRGGHSLPRLASACVPTCVRA